MFFFVKKKSNYLRQGSSLSLTLGKITRDATNRFLMNFSRNVLVMLWILEGPLIIKQSTAIAQPRITAAYARSTYDAARVRQMWVSELPGGGLRLLFQLMPSIVSGPLRIKAQLRAQQKPSLRLTAVCFSAFALLNKREGGGCKGSRAERRLSVCHSNVTDDQQRGGGVITKNNTCTKGEPQKVPCE